MIDIITVVFRDELGVLPVQAESIWRYAGGLDPQKILVLVNDSDDIADKISPHWWGPLADRVKIIPRSHFSTDYSDNGWLSQQVIKMQGSALSQSQWSMVLDAKTILIRSMTRELVFDDQGRARCGWIPVIPVFQPAADIARDLFGMDQQQMLQPAGVPFFFHNPSMRNMIAWTESHTSQKFESWFQDQGMLTEFVIYSMWISKHGQDLYTSNGSGWLRVCNVCHTQTERFDQILDTLATSSVTISVHRNAWRNLDQRQRQRFQDLLTTKGIESASAL